MPDNVSHSRDRMIVEQSYWDQGYEKRRFFRLPDNDATAVLLKEYIPKASAGDMAFEIGCFPGRFLAELGDLGYILSGCDLTPRVAEDLSPWLSKQGYRVGDFFHDPYEKHIDKQFDLVASFGFIEHFENFDEVFQDHCKMVKNGGYLIVQFPNFRGSVQNKLHSLFDNDNLANHVVDAMNTDYYASILPDDFEILFNGYYGAFDFWYDDFKKRHSPATKLVLKSFLKTKPLWKLARNDARWSPNGAIIARRKL